MKCINLLILLVFLTSCSYIQNSWQKPSIDILSNQTFQLKEQINELDCIPENVLTNEIKFFKMNLNSPITRSLDQSIITVMSIKSHDCILFKYSKELEDLHENMLLYESGEYNKIGE